MYLWHVDRLVADFRADNVSEKEKFKYILFYGIVMSLVANPLVWIGTKYSLMDTVNLLATLVVVIAGTYYCYTSNRNADNKDFVTRFVCLGVPIGVRMLLVFVPLVIVIGIVEGIYGVGVEITTSGEEGYSTTVSQVIVTVLISALFYRYLGNKLKSIATGNSA